MTRLPFLLLCCSISVAAQAPAPKTPIGTPLPGVAPPAKPDTTDAFSTIEGRVIAADTGAPLRGANVRISGSGRTTANINRTAVTDRQGRYRFNDVVPVVDIDLYFATWVHPDACWAKASARACPDVDGAVCGD